MTNTLQKILTAAQIRSLEEKTHQNGVSYTDMMQRASEVVFHFIKAHYRPGKMCVLCGPGHNGGDGIATAILLKNDGWSVDVMADTSQLPHKSEAIRHFFEAWTGPILPITSAIPEDAELILDALFGFGLDKPVSAEYASLIQRANEHHAHRIAIDMPSGINSDTGAVMGIALEAHHTITFQYPKPGQFLLPGKEYCGYLTIEPIGLVKPDSSEMILNEPVYWQDYLPNPKLSDHKYTNGHLGVFCGDEMTGAPRLAADASRYIGTGLVTLLAPKGSVDIYAETMPGCLVTEYSSLTSIEKILSTKSFTAFVIGPGLSANQKTASLVMRALKTKKPLLLDAGALTCFKTESTRSSFLKALHDKCLLTPHEGEFHALFPDIDKKLSKMDKVRLAMQKTRAAILLKGNDSLIVQDGKPIVINHNAPPFLATAGSGDVLAGVAGGFMSKQIPAHMAGSMATWLAGVAGSYLGFGLIAEELPMAIRQILRNLLFPGKGQEFSQDRELP